MRESLAARQQSDLKIGLLTGGKALPHLGKLVRLRLQSAEQLALALLSTGLQSAKRLDITEESSDIQDRYSLLKLALLTSGGILTTGPHQCSERKY